MTTDYWNELEDLFCRAVELPADQRAALLDRECHDEDMRAELESMLQHDPSGGSSLRDAVQSAAEAIAEIEEDPWLGTMAGVYRIVEKIADGGMGSVYLGERADNQYEQRVAIKLLSTGVVLASAKSRFFRERQILASLDHPNIAQLLDGGTTDNGVPFLVMEYIDGVPIDEYCDREELSIRDRLGLLRAVCGAVEYAHRNLIVHRDIKPGNILITANGVPKLLDFGIAKLLAEHASHTAATTRADDRLLTPRYASPEQILGDPVTTATDVYAIGVLMYELLSGHLPYEFDRHRPQDIEKTICNSEPERPSTVAARVDSGVVSRKRRTTPARLRKQLRGDLDNIILVAMRKEPERRYGTVRTMLEDIERHLENRPVLARPTSFRYRAGKFASRNRYRLAIASASAAVFAGLVGFYTAQLAAERDLVIAERDTAAATADFLVSLFEQSDPEVSRGRPVSARELLDRGAEGFAGRLSGDPLLRARLKYTLGRVYFNLGEFEEADRFAAQIVEELGGSGPESRLPVADALVLRGNVATARDDFQAAENFFDSGLAIYRKDAGEDGLRTLRTLVTIGEMQNSYGGAAEGISRCERADAMLAGAKDSERLELYARTKICLGKSYLTAGRPEDAQAAVEVARTILTSMHGSEHPDVAKAEQQLGSVEFYLGNFQAAKAHYQRALAVMQRVLGERHATLAESFVQIANVQSLLAEYEQAEANIAMALDILREQFDDEHSLVGVALHINGNIMLDQGRNAEGEVLFRESLSQMQRLLEPSHEYISMAHNSLASALEFQGKFEEAEQHFRAAIRLSELHQGPDFLPTIIHISNLGAMFASKGDYQSALPFIEEALERGRAKLGPDHPDVVIFNHAHGKVLGYLGRPDEAVKILDEVGEDFRRIYGTAHWRYARWTTDRGELCLSMGDLECAQELLTKALTLTREAVGTEHNYYATALYQTAQLRHALGEPDAARELARQALAIQQGNSLPDEHISVMRTQELLAAL